LENVLCQLPKGRKGWPHRGTASG